MTEDAIILACARAAHEANRAYCIAIGDASQLPWEAAPLWQHKSACAGVRQALAGVTPEQQHQAWCLDKRVDGWVLGAAKDQDRKTHPCLVPYAELPEQQRRKDELFGKVARAVAKALETTDAR